MTIEDYIRKTQRSNSDSLKYLYTMDGTEYMGFICRDPNTNDAKIILAKNIKAAFKYSQDKSELVNARENYYELFIESIEDISDVQLYETDEPKPYSAQDIKYRKMIIIGAGASYDVIPFLSLAQKGMNNLMPLTNNLFSAENFELLNRYSGAKQASKNPLINSNLEAYFQKIVNELNRHGNRALIKQLLDSTYYINDLIIERQSQVAYNQYNNYKLLAEQVRAYLNSHKDEGIIIVNFNYDTLLDNELESELGLKYVNMEDYIKRGNKLLYLKPHGSVNWVWFFKERLTLRTQYHQRLHELLIDRDYSFHQIKLLLESKITHAGSVEFLAKYNNIVDYLPAILIPYSRKDSFVVPEQQKFDFTMSISNIDEILVVGWKGQEDEFTNTLTGRINTQQIRVTSVTNSKSSETKYEWMRERQHEDSLVFSSNAITSSVLDNIIETHKLSINRSSEEIEVKENISGTFSYFMNYITNTSNEKICFLQDIES